jgi:hypothetical protein
VIWQEGAGDSNAPFLVTSSLVICSDIVSKVVRPPSFKVYPIHFPLANLILSVFLWLLLNLKLISASGP